MVTTARWPEKPTAPWPDQDYHGPLADVVPIVYVVVIVIVIVPHTHNEDILSLGPTFHIEGQVARQTNDDDATPGSNLRAAPPGPCQTRRVNKDISPPNICIYLHYRFDFALIR